MTDFDEVYRVLGRKVRQMREVQRMSHDSLAQHLGISRASMVNIEAGRQRAPLHLLWQIAEVLHCKLIELIPTPDEVAVRPNQGLLDREVIDQIEEVADGDPATIKLLTGFSGSATRSRQERCPHCISRGNGAVPVRGRSRLRAVRLHRFHGPGCCRALSSRGIPNRPDLIGSDRIGKDGEAFCPAAQNRQFDRPVSVPQSVNPS